MTHLEHLARTLGGHKAGSGYLVHCPAHDDRNPSLSVREQNGTLLVKCHAGCAQADVIAALRAQGLWHSDGGDWEQRIVATYDYTDEHGMLLYQVVRLHPKDFRQRRPDGAGGWVWNLKGTRRVPYRLREVLENPIIFLVEGEKDVETLREWGFTATTTPGGAKAPWLPQYTEVLTDKELIVVPDNDAPGWARAKKLCNQLMGKIARLRLFELPDDCKDITEFFEKGHSECELIADLEGVDAV